jgi:myo-inositol catabolism protein IolH
MKIALDPYMLRGLPFREVCRTAADVGYEWIELSLARTSSRSSASASRPGAGGRVRDGASETGVGLSSILPLYRWSSPDEDERQAAVRYWKRPSSWPRTSTAGR